MTLQTVAAGVFFRDGESGTRCARTRPLSNTLGLADQLVVSQEDSVRKHGNVGGKVPEFSAQSYFVDLFSCAW